MHPLQRHVHRAQLLENHQADVVIAAMAAGVHIRVRVDAVEIIGVDMVVVAIGRSASAVLECRSIMLCRVKRRGRVR